LEHGLFFRAKIQLESFEAAAMPHLTDLHRTASFLLRDPHEAEDLIQETYLEAWKSFHRFELGTNCRAWLFKIMFHLRERQTDREVSRFGPAAASSERCGAIPR
jgi:DNA-directed RNA polymerase specialized sigma24 family protein